MRTETAIHDVATIEVGDRRFHDGASPFWTREIVITHKDGGTHTLSLYSKGEDEETVLRVLS